MSERLQELIYEWERSAQAAAGRGTKHEAGKAFGFLTAALDLRKALLARLRL